MENKIELEERKKEEIEFHNRKIIVELSKDEKELNCLNSNKKFYSVIRARNLFFTKWLNERIERNKNITILDYCCGTGELAIFLAEKGTEVFGIDISDMAIEKARKNASNKGLNKRAHFFLMDAEKMDFKESFFDLIICHAALHHLDIKNAYIELFRVLNPSGEIICMEPLAYNPIFQLYRKLTPRLRTKWEMEHILTKKEINAAKKYFKKIEIKFYSLTTLLAFPFRKFAIFNIILGILEKIDSFLLKLPLLKWLAWEVVFILSQPRKN